MTSEVAVADSAIEIMERVVVQGDLAKLSAEDRVRYYAEVCKSLGLNPLTRPFEYISLNGRLTLYATKTCTDQLRALKGISVTRLEREVVEGIYSVTAYGQDRSGRIDSSIGAVPIETLKGEARANAMMKTETKAKRRLTLSLVGLGWLDEVEVDSVPSAQRTDVDQDTGEIVKPRTLRETVAEKRAELDEPHTDPGEVTPPESSESVAPVAPPPGADDSEPAVVSSPEDPKPSVATAGSLSRVEFQRLIKKHDDIKQGDVVAESQALFPGIDPRDLNDEQRGTLWRWLSQPDGLLGAAQTVFPEGVLVP